MLYTAFPPLSLCILQNSMIYIYFLDKEPFDKGLKISKSDLDIFKAATVIEELSPKVLTVKVISIVLLLSEPD